MAIADIMAKKRFPITLPPWHEKRLLFWAYCKGTTKTQMAINTLQARIEANEQQIDRMLAERAESLGISVEELQQQILEASNWAEPGFGGEGD
jgi:hypothetical protein